MKVDARNLSYKVEYVNLGSSEATHFADGVSWLDLVELMRAHNPDRFVLDVKRFIDDGEHDLKDILVVVPIEFPKCYLVSIES